MAQPSLLTRLQRAFLEEFFRQPVGQEFFLTGGTALAEFYLRHRYSEDIDLFTLNDAALQDVSNSLPAIAAHLNATVEDRFRTISFRQAFLRLGSEELKIDFVRDVGAQFGEHRRYGSVVVDSELNIAVNKVTAIFGRITSKDFVDLYFLLNKGYDLDELMRLAKEKDLGFTEFYFAGMLRENRRITTLPRMIQPLTAEELRAFFEPLATKLVRRLKPPE
ncbi:MAG: nucleotidyl transferase AbiEii/AbiGii toxin family protein [Chloroflexi bacterium]|nr:nucleotidyl transferase AbiEii/AbiGii toxin family protein [Chloroflexota bacterium]